MLADSLADWSALLGQRVVPITDDGLDDDFEDPGRAYVWSWLPRAIKPVPTGILEALPAPGGGYGVTFAYGRSYLRELWGNQVMNPFASFATLRRRSCPGCRLR